MNRNLLIAILGIVVLLLILVATGVLDFSSQGGELPDVDVSATGGELPEVNADVADVDVGTKETTVEVPTVEVDKAESN